MTDSACDAIRPLLSSALDRQLPDRELARVEAHVLACPACRDERTRLEGTVTLLRTNVLVPSSPDFLARLDERLSEESARRADTLPRGEVIAAAFPTELTAPVATRAWLAWAKRAAVILCVATSSFLFLEAIVGTKGQTPVAFKHANDLIPKDVPPPPPAPVPPPVVPPPEPIAGSQVPEPDPQPLFSEEELRRALQPLESEPEPGITSPPPPPPPAPAPAPPPVAAPAPPPAPLPTTVERPQPSAPPTVSTPGHGKPDEGALDRLLAAIFMDPATPAARRPEMILALGDFPARRACEGLGRVVAGAFDATATARECRVAGYVALGTIGNEDAVRVLLGVERADETQLLLALARVKEPKAVLIVAQHVAAARDGERRILAARALGRARRAEAVPLLVQALGDGKQLALVRAEAALALGAIGDGRAVEPLRIALGSSRVEAIVRGAAARGLGALAGGADAAVALKAARALVEPLGRDGHPFVREACALALGKSRQIDVALRPLVDRLDPKREKSRRVRFAAQAALVELTGSWRDADAWRRAVEKKETVAPRAAGPIQVATGNDFLALLASGDGTVVALDRSGSMEERNKMALARATATGVVEHLVESAHDRGPRGFSLVYFADAPIAQWPRLVEPSADNVESARTGIARQRPYWAPTDLLRAIRTALSIEGTDTVVLITDGAPTLGVQDSEALLLSVQRANAERGARIHVVALADGSSPLVLDGRPEGGPDESPEHRLLRRIALDSGGLFVKN